MIAINSFDEPRVLQRIARKTDQALFQWTVTDGLRRANFGLQVEQQADNTEPKKLLKYLKTRAGAGIYAICDFHPWLEDAPKIVRLIKDIALKNEHGAITLAFISPELKLPAELLRLSAKFNLQGINRAKFQIMDLDAVISYEYQVSAFSEVAGMENFKQWLEKRHHIFTAPASVMDTPKGVLLLGVQGGGKSLAAKAVAGQWGIPLLRLDMGALYNKFYGETEKNLRQSLTLADNMSPCVLWR